MSCREQTGCLFPVELELDQAVAFRVVAELLLSPVGANVALGYQIRGL